MASDSARKSVGEQVATIVKLTFLVTCASLSCLGLVIQQIFQVISHFLNFSLVTNIIMSFRAAGRQ